MSDQEQVENSEQLAALGDSPIGIMGEQKVEGGSAQSNAYRLPLPTPLTAQEVSALIDQRLAALRSEIEQRMETLTVNQNRLAILGLLTQHSANSGATAESVVQKAKVLEMYLREG